jgi:hypothetical protein
MRDPQLEDLMLRRSSSERDFVASVVVVIPHPLSKKGTGHHHAGPLAPCSYWTRSLTSTVCWYTNSPFSTRWMESSVSVVSPSSSKLQVPRAPW